MRSSLSVIHASLRLRIAAVIAVVIGAFAPCYAQGDLFSKDERLTKTITARCVDSPLVALLEQLSASSGVKLRTSEDHEDRPITVRVKQMALRDFLHTLALEYGDE